MKLIIVNNEMVILESVKRVTRIIEGSGAKSNPYRYLIRIEYFNDEKAINIHCENETQFNKSFEEIYKILSEKPLTN